MVSDGFAHRHRSTLHMCLCIHICQSVCRIDAVMFEHLEHAGELDVVTVRAAPAVPLRFPGIVPLARRILRAVAQRLDGVVLWEEAEAWGPSSN